MRSLRHSKAARYTDLRQPTGFQSDVFKYHLRKMVQWNYVLKHYSGIYTLTPSGKEFANTLNKLHRTPLKQPKLSVIIIARKETASHTKYHMQQRLRSPYYGYWGAISGPVQWGESFEEAAARELSKLTGYAADFKVIAFYRKTDSAHGNEEILEDKLFVVIWTSRLKMISDWKYLRGRNNWITLEDLKSKDKYFNSTCEFMEMIKNGESYRRSAVKYRLEDY